VSGFVASTLKEVEMLLKYGAATASAGVQDDHIAVANRQHLLEFKTTILPW